MEQVSKYDNVEILLRNNLVRIGDLINMDGPMLVVFRDTIGGDLYLFDWVDNDDKSNRWLIYNVDKKDLIIFLKTRISYKTLFEKNGSILYYTDIASEQIQAFKIFKLKEVPVGYKPDKDVLFDSSDSKNLDKILHALKLDSNLTEYDYLKEYNIMGVTLNIGLATQDDIASQWWNDKSNILTGKTRPARIYTQPNASKSNRIPKQKGMVLR